VTAFGHGGGHLVERREKRMGMDVDWLSEKKSKKKGRPQRGRSKANRGSA